MIPTDGRTDGQAYWCAEGATEGGGDPACLAASVAVVFVANVFIIVVGRDRIPLE